MKLQHLFERIFRTISLRRGFRNKIPPDLMENRGGKWWNLEKLPNRLSLRLQPQGVGRHANLLSQILSGAIEGREFIKVLPEKLEWLWILIWSFNGASLSWFFLELTSSYKHMLIKWTSDDFQHFRNSRFFILGQ